MNDRELLKLAAKAAGIAVRLHCEGGLYRLERGVLTLPWNPLADDADALRLAVALVMSVEISEFEASTYAYAGPIERVYAMELWRQDRAAATRRAIVRAAAEIGKGMP